MIKWFYKSFQQRAFKMIAERLNRDMHGYHLRTHNNFDNLKKALKKGDIILVEGNKLISRVIMAVTHSTWSHCALYVGDGKIIDPLPSTGTVINAVDVLQDLNIRVCRPFGLTDDKLSRVCEFALSHVGRRYDHLNISKILIHLFKTEKDSSEFLGDISGASEVCSGLIAEAYNQVGFSIISGVNFSQIVPGDFDLSPNFEIIKFNRIYFGKDTAAEVARDWDGKSLHTGSEQ